MKIIPDTSVIIDGGVTDKIEKGEFQGDEIIISEAVIGELETQANKGQETGMSGLEELENLRAMADEGKIELRFKGDRPSLEDIKLAPGGEIDYMIRELAAAEEGLLFTSDIVQAEIARTKGLRVEYVSPRYERGLEAGRIWDYFDENVMSVHLRTGVKPKAKVGTPGHIEMKTIGDEKLTEKELRGLAHEIIESAERSSDGFIEVDKGGATVVQLEDLRIVISRPPFSDGFEITAVRPVAKLSLEDYDFSEDLKERLAEKQRGVLLAGSPGAGKSTLAQAIAEYLMKKDFTVKTMEEPRDLQVPDNITQYTSLDGEIEDTGDLLLLVRPDYTIYDEVRKTPHFKVFADMRLAGVGMVGVTHANRAIDALQRLIGRVELGMVPQVVDTIVFVEEGEIRKVYEISYTVKVPAGMMEEDLARPVIEVQDFESGVPEYEVYTYGEQVVVMPIEESEAGRKPIWEMAEQQIEEEMSRYVRGPVKAVMTSSDSVRIHVPENKIPSILGKDGENIDRIEAELGLNIDVRAMGEMEKGQKKTKKKSVDVFVNKDKVVLEVGADMTGQTVDIYGEGEYLFTATVGSDGTIKIRKGTPDARKILKKKDLVDRFEAR